MDTIDSAGQGVADFGNMFVIRVARAVITRGRPFLGWLPLLLLTVLNGLTALSIGNAGWVRQTPIQNGLVVAGALAPALLWALAGWVAPPQVRRLRIVAQMAVALVAFLLGLLLLSLIFVRWAPPPLLLWQALRGDFAPALNFMQDVVAGFAARVDLWWLGVQAGGAAVDESIFGILAGALLWLAGLAGAALLRATRQGLAGALPSLVLLGGVVFLSISGRPLFIVALALALALHVACDNNRLLAGWEARRLDYNPGLVLERWFGAAGLAAVALAVAGFAPVISVQRIADFYARLVAPVDARLEGARRVSFPNVQVAPRLSVAGTTTGLPNDFLLGSGPELNAEPILTVRTSDAGGLEEPSERPYLRALLLDIYTGRGWEEAETAARVRQPAQTPRTLPTDGRRMLAQTVRLHRSAYNWFVAAEPLQFGADATLRLDAQGQLLAATGNPATYSALSAVPALDAESLAALPAWGEENPLPPGFEAYLALPETVTARTHGLAEELIAGQTSPFLQATAIEAYLREFAYDLDIPAPPAEVTDVADWFLFDLQRGYCDYYATAFVVLARSVGLPARFVVGYAPGNWQPYEQQWRVTAAQSHAWAELYLPSIGWLPFEPTAGRLPLNRVGSATIADAPPGVVPLPPPAPPAESFWTWQMLVWLLPLGAIGWGGASLWRAWRARRADPWQSLLAWGSRAGRPPAPGETPLEYGEALASMTETWAAAASERESRLRGTAREAAAATRALSAAAAGVHYAPAAARAANVVAAQEHWQRLRGLLPPLLAPLRRSRRRAQHTPRAEKS